MLSETAESWGGQEYSLQDIVGQMGAGYKRGIIVEMGIRVYRTKHIVIERGKKEDRPIGHIGVDWDQGIIVDILLYIGIRI